MSSCSLLNILERKKKQFWPLFVALFCDSINLLRHAGCTLPIFAKYFVKNWIGPKKSKWAIFFGDSARLLLRRCAICPSPSLLRRGYGGTWRTHGKLLRPNWGNVEWMESGSTKASSQLPERWNNKRKRPSFSSTLTTIATPLHKRRIKGSQSSWLDIVWNPWKSIICYNALHRHSGNTHTWYKLYILLFQFLNLLSFWPESHVYKVKIKIYAPGEKTEVFGLPESHFCHPWPSDHIYLFNSGSLWPNALLQRGGVDSTLADISFYFAAS